MATEPAFLYHNWANPGNKFALKIGAAYAPDLADRLHLRFVQRYELPMQAANNVSNLVNKYQGEEDPLKRQIEAAITEAKKTK